MSTDQTALLERPVCNERITLLSQLREDLACVFERCRVGANSVVIADVPARRTVVGIPARVVRHRGESRPNPYGVDLNHHLTPDPVASAIACLLDRIRILEQGQAGSGAMPDEDCDECNAMELCETATPASGGVSREPTRG